MNNIQPHNNLPLLEEMAPNEWIGELLDSQLGTVVIYVPLSIANGLVTEFTIQVMNDVAHTPIPPCTELMAYDSLADIFNHDKASQLTLQEQLQEVYEKGLKIKRNYYHPTSNQFFDIITTRIRQGILAIILNKTTEVQGQIQNKSSTDLVSGILNATINGVFALQAVYNDKGEIEDFTFLKVNQQFAAMLQMHETEIIGKSYLTLLPYSVANGLFGIKQEVVHTGQTVSKEIYYDSFGKWFYISISKLGNDGIVETVMDITDSKKDKQEAERTAQKLHTIISTSQSGVHIFKPEYDDAGQIIDFRMVLVNQTIAAYIGQTVETLIGALASTYFPDYKRNGLFEIYRDVFLYNESRQFDFHYEDGYDVFFNLLVVKLGDELMVTLTDHTALNRTQRDLEASITELKRSNASLEQFAHAASHDLQEPLRKIILNSERLLQEYANELDDNGYGILERIRTAGKRMHRLVKDLLVFAEVGANRNTFDEVDLDELVAEVINDLEVAITERDAQIEMAPLGKITGDSIHLQQLFQNLLSNALKYSRHDVTPQIHITATSMLGGDTGLTLAEPQKGQTFFVIQIQDNGQGFSADEAKQIFKIFQRLPQHQHDYAGTGIGLAIVQRVVENHKGYITAEGIKGTGATFKIYLPV